MMALAKNDPLPEQPATGQQQALSEELVELFGCVNEPAVTIDIHEGQIDEELQRWRVEPSALMKHPDGSQENVLDFWRRQSESNNYKYLSRLARMVFALPSSSAQIERDFGLSGLMVSSQRTNLSKYNVEMASFLGCNRAFVDVAQCERLSSEEIGSHIPTHALVGALDDDDLNALDDDYSFIANHFSSASIDGDEYELGET
ncbi:hypothetical protein PINS_up019353 [Pythium insidiosum]|nr:hypothetical protein PINS_up019353 [Pythium insidiosum]